MIAVEHLSKNFGGIKAVNDVSLSIEAGSITGLIGPNGAGKTTTLKSIMGLMGRTRGSVNFKGEELLRQPAHVRFALGLAYVPEERRIVQGLSVRENLRLGLVASKHKKREAELIAEIAAIFPRLAERMDQEAVTMSGGEQQMLAIGRALMMQPQILILDEPTLGLAPVILELLSKALEKLRQTTKITVLLGEQNVTFALPHADRVYVLEHARIVWEGDPGRFAAEAGKDFL